MASSGSGSTCASASSRTASGRPTMPSSPPAVPRGQGFAANQAAFARSVPSTGSRRSLLIGIGITAALVADQPPASGGKRQGLGVEMPARRIGKGFLGQDRQGTGHRRRRIRPVQLEQPAAVTQEQEMAAIETGARDAPEIAVRGAELERSQKLE